MSDRHSATECDSNDHSGKRACTGCGSPLSQYNPGPLCQICISKGRAERQSLPDKITVDGGKIAKLRRSRGWTQSIFADRIGFSVDLVKKLEQPRRGGSVSLNTLYTVAHVLQVPLTDLLKSSSQGVPPVREPAASQPSVTVKPAGIPGTYELHTRFSTELTRFMKMRDVSGRDLARRSHFTPGYISYLRSGSRRPALESAQLIDNALNAGGRLAEAAMADIAEAEKEKSSLPAWVARNGLHIPDNMWGVAYAGEFEVDDVERRELLKIFGGIAAAVPFANGIDRLRRDLDSTLNSPTTKADVEEWERVASQYAMDSGLIPPSRLLPELLTDLDEAQFRLKNSPENLYGPMTRVCGQLSALAAINLFNAGDERNAHRYWRTTLRTIAHSDDRSAQAMLHGQRAVFALYERQSSPADVLALSEDAISIANSAPCIGATYAYSARAMAFAMLGEHDKSTRTVNELAEITPRTTSAFGAWGWSEQQLRFIESRVYAYAGHVADSVKAHEAGISIVPADQWLAISQFQLNMATCIIADGDPSEGAQYVIRTLQALPNGYRQSVPVCQSAARALNLVPDRAANAPTVREARELLSLPPASA